MTFSSAAHSRWYVGITVLLIALWLPSGAQAANINCSVSTSNVNLGTLTPANTDTANVTGHPVTWSCTNTSTGQYDGDYRSLCVGIDGGAYAPGTIVPRYMSKNGSLSSSAPKLAFDIRRQSTVVQPEGRWGRRTGANDTNNEEVTNFFYIQKDSTRTDDFYMDVTLLSGYNNQTVPPGNYSASFASGTNTSFTYSKTDNSGQQTKCKFQPEGPTGITFTVNATVTPDCKITTTNDVNLGNHSASDTNITGQNSAIGVTCTNTTPYYIGLAPSNGNVNGAGIMEAGGGNTDKVPYRLRSTPGLGGTIWGNTATSTSVGNGVAGTGSGSEQTETVYVTVPDADVTPDTYSDTVTINVHY